MRNGARFFVVSGFPLSRGITRIGRARVCCHSGGGGNPKSDSVHAALAIAHLFEAPDCERAVAISQCARLDLPSVHPSESSSARQPTAVRRNSGSCKPEPTQTGVLAARPAVQAAEPAASGAVAQAGQLVGDERRSDDHGRRAREVELARLLPVQLARRRRLRDGLVEVEQLDRPSRRMSARRCRCASRRRWSEFRDGDSVIQPARLAHARPRTRRELPSMCGNSRNPTRFREGTARFHLTRHPLHGRKCPIGTPATAGA